MAQPETSRATLEKKPSVQTARSQNGSAVSSREEYLALLNEMTHAILLADNFDATLNALALDMARLVGADDCYITRWDEERRLTIPTVTTASLPFQYSLDAEKNPEVNSFTASVLRAEHALAVEDVFDSPHISAEIATRYPARSALGVPLIARGQKLGAALIAFNTPHQFTSEEIERAEEAGNLVSLALWNFQQSAELQHRLNESHVLAKIGRALSETERVSTSGVLQLIVDSARELIPQAEKSVIHLLEAEEQALFAHAVSGFGEAEKGFGRVKMRLGEGVAGQVIREGGHDQYWGYPDPSRFYTRRFVARISILAGCAGAQWQPTDRHDQRSKRPVKRLFDEGCRVTERPGHTSRDCHRELEFVREYATTVKRGRGAIPNQPRIGGIAGYRRIDRGGRKTSSS